MRKNMHTRKQQRHAGTYAPRTFKKNSIIKNQLILVLFIISAISKIEHKNKVKNYFTDGIIIGR